VRQKSNDPSIILITEIGSIEGRHGEFYVFGVIFKKDHERICIQDKVNEVRISVA
jgi:hypothetical protein